ncbi:MAG TPA: arginine--tRNA ligase [Candidatus Nanoarchaeia archaeon]|nr:arginine--tRNA ligase [Candidatus Nanoarchaeia archaeon]
MDFRQIIADALKKELGKDIVLEVPPDAAMGDFAYPCFELSKEMKKSPMQIAQELSKKLPSIVGVSEVKAIGPYVNFFVDKQSLMKDTLLKVFDEKEKYGGSSIGKGKTIVIDYSSPNIAKPFGIAHIRSTVIGNSLYKIYGKLGYKVVRVNHLGDWGTQFGKLIVAYKNWGEGEKLASHGIGHLVDLYIKFGEEAKLNPVMEDEARSWFKRLEDGDKEALKLWELFREMSLQEFDKYYKRLHVEFDSYSGEAFYNDKVEGTIKHISSKTETKLDDGALIVDLKQYNMPPVLLRKSNETSTYHARDLAAIFYRLKEYKPEKILYVVDARQQLHFQQLFKVMELSGEDKRKLEHLQFGLMTYEGSAMSTRAGNFVLLEEVLDKAIELALSTIDKKNPALKNKHTVAEQVGIGAIIFGDLVNDRARDVDFTWDKALDFEGETGPYLQYTHARMCSLLRKSEKKISSKIDFSMLNNEKELIKALHNFNEAIMQAHTNNKPHVIARYLLDVAQLFNSYYQNNPILKEEEKIKSARLLVVDCVRQVLKNGLELLGLEAPEEM